MTRRHIATVIGPDPVNARPDSLRRREADRVARPRVLVYTEGDRVEVLVEPHDGAALDADGAADLLNALARAVRTLDGNPPAEVGPPPAPDRIARALAAIRSHDAQGHHSTGTLDEVARILTGRDVALIAEDLPPRADEGEVRAFYGLDGEAGR